MAVLQYLKGGCRSLPDKSYRSLRTLCAFHHCGKYGPRHPTTLGPLKLGLSVQLRRTFHHHSVGASQTHLQEELLQNPDRIRVDTQYGPVTGGRANTGAIAFLEIPYALPPGRFQDPQSLPPEHHYEDKEYLYEARYCAQPKKELIAGAPYESIVGLGEPTENPLFVNIVCPRDFKPSSNRKYPVKVYIHGGFLQLGSPHELNSQAQYIAAERSEIWVNIGYRVSVFGFLACDEPKLSGNYGFKDQWLALLWIRDNIERFGGDPKDIQITGLSAGGHSVQQILHHATRGGLPPHGQAPFQSAMIQSNGILTNPETPSERRPQFEALCWSLGLDPRSPTILDQLRDPVALPWQRLTHVIETGEIGTAFDTFRGTLDGAQWLADDPDPMTWQRSGAFARALRDKGVRSVVVGDLADEWFVYGFTHPVSSLGDVEANLLKYYPAGVVTDLLASYDIPQGLEEDENELRKFMGMVLADGQVYMPTRLLARDLIGTGFPVLRYAIDWLPDSVLYPAGYVSHGLDRVIWAYRRALLEQSEVPVFLGWLDAIDAQRRTIEAGMNSEAKNMRRVFALKEDGSRGWQDDGRWDEIIQKIQTLPGEVKSLR